MIHSKYSHKTQTKIARNNKLKKKKANDVQLGVKLGSRTSCKCELCNETYSNKYTLKMHMETDHENKANFHGTGAATQSNLNSANEKQKLHECTICKNSFHEKSLERHIKTVHEKQRPHKCQICKSSFGEKSNLTKHINKLHYK